MTFETYILPRQITKKNKTPTLYNRPTTMIYCLQKYFVLNKSYLHVHGMENNMIFFCQTPSKAGTYFRLL